MVSFHLFLLSHVFIDFLCPNFGIVASGAVGIVAGGYGTRLSRPRERFSCLLSVHLAAIGTWK